MRMIDADALKTKMLDYYSYSWQLREEIGDFFDNAPTIESQKWIPVSERLPEEGKQVLISLKNGKVLEGNWHSFYDDVLAWMPLPEPYKEGEE